MKKYIEELKTKSHAEKSNYAFMASAVITGVVALVWVLSIIANPSGYMPIANISEGSSEEQNLANAGSLFDVFKSSIEGFK